MGRPFHTLPELFGIYSGLLTLNYHELDRIAAYYSLTTQTKGREGVDQLLIVVDPQGDVLGVFTSGVDAHLVAKAADGAVWRCGANSEKAVRLESAVRESIANASFTG